MDAIIAVLVVTIYVGSLLLGSWVASLTSRVGRVAALVLMGGSLSYSLWVIYYTPISLEHAFSLMLIVVLPTLLFMTGLLTTVMVRWIRG